MTLLIQILARKVKISSTYLISFTLTTYCSHLISLVIIPGVQSTMNSYIFQCKQR